MNPTYIGVIFGVYWDNGKSDGNFRDYRVYIGVISGYIGVVRTLKIKVGQYCLSECPYSTPVVSIYISCRIVSNLTAGLRVQGLTI